ncbi:DNA glycosylase AlkZ-like family protein [Klenkia taihuensis]|uniref:Winged helix DNA-binding domain-containing protein n=1 Tax=Klenkia taihuensis TaxID=1225127 RepID=A0A1I1QS57_9ACTN|nr:crosslink repair DNA glycosylase YcaQ family protein [Klenkia taihuensis]GHE07533.1 hypothetical protein GCM10011381_04370 [Klenkia taihuensis]SFD24837.1 hypothetical protein SAMN05661030_2932 [Klenkia taihuensis]
MHRLGVDEARRIAVRAQLLDADRPAGLLGVVDRLAFLQLDPTAAVAPSADLVLWTRLGAAYRPEELRRALDVDRTLFELHACVRPMADLRLFRARMQRAPEYLRPREWLAANRAFAADVVARLRADGPLLSKEIPDTAAVPWASTGWTGNRNVTQMLEVLAGRGEVAIGGRRGKQRLWDLAERVYPSDVEVLPFAEAEQERDRRRLRALGIARSRTDQSSVEANDVGEAGEPAVVDGVPGEWRVDPDQLGRTSTGRTALLSPFDRLVHDRRRALELFGFEYTLEMYKPAAARRWGYFALPVLHADRLVGKVDAAADRRAGTFTVAAVHQDVPFTPAVTEDVDAELAALADWLGLALRR